MKRLPAVLVLALAAAGCTGPAAPAPTQPAAPASAPAPAGTPVTPETPGSRPTESPTPDPLPSIPPKLPNEIVRTTFGGDAVGNEVATHRFVGQIVSIHLLCASHEGEVDVALLVDRVERTSFTNPCTTPQFTVEDASFSAGEHEVFFQVEHRGGATGVVYLLEGDI